MQRRNRVFGSLAMFGSLLGVAALAGACSSTPEMTGASSEAVTAVTSAANLAHGRDVWFKSTFGGEKFFSLILPSAPFSLPLGIDNVLLTPRSQRFAQWGTINDPDCTDGDASTGGYDKCPDPGATGVVGIRKSANPYFNAGAPPSAANPPFIVGVACAGCHAGFDPANPPADPSRPTWANIHPTTGNQYIQVGKIFGANISPHDPRYQVFRTWAPGAVDTTAIESDGINNPGIITQFYVFDERPYFDNTYQGTPEHVHRAGQGGEDDSGCQRAALRVYFNIGMCAAECMIPHLTNGPGGTQTPIDMNECAQKCPDFVQAQKDVVDECAFINDTRSTPPPKLQTVPGGAAYIDESAVERGGRVFQATCAGCHSNGQPSPLNDYSDDQMHLATGFNPLFGELPGDIGTNKCRSLSTNWNTGHIWQSFASDQLHAQKDQIAQGKSYYRDVPLLGIWATAPFFHNNRLGKYTGDPSLGGRIAAYEDAVQLLLNPVKRDFLGSIQSTSDWITLPTFPYVLPAGTPVALFANVNQATGQNLCPELVENGGHYYGALLPDADKYALKEYLKTL